MNKGTVVIGAAFGDEGKGLMTDYFADATADSLVIRFNGGAQAGHTVVTPDGRRHVFHHFGSGTLAERPTFLASEFILNPVLFQEERAELRPLTARHRAEIVVLADPQCRVTLIADMMLNQWVEEERGNGRHGSCGVGIGETIERDEHFPLRYAAARNMTGNQLLAFLVQVNEEWVPQRAAALGIELTAQRQTYLESALTMARWLAAFEQMRIAVPPVTPEELLKGGFEQFIFEGAQGLGLDGRLDNPYFPHVTRSRTGRTNVIPLAEQLKIGELNFTYVTRAYLTRHGAGPLPGEMQWLPYAHVKDNTNVPHAFQGQLRFGYLDLDLLQRHIWLDYYDTPTKIPTHMTLALTHLDQVSDPFTYWSNGSKSLAEREDLPDLFREKLSLNLSHLSFGPTRVHVVTKREYFANPPRKLARA